MQQGELGREGEHHLGLPSNTPLSIFSSILKDL